MRLLWRSALQIYRIVCADVRDNIDATMTATWVGLLLVCESAWHPLCSSPSVSPQSSSRVFETVVHPSACALASVQVNLTTSVDYVKVEHLVDIATTKALGYMARTKQRRTYLPYTFPAIAGTHLRTTPVAKSEHPRLTNGEIIFEEFQPMWSQSTNVTDRRTDGETDRRHAIAIPRFALKCIEL